MKSEFEGKHLPGRPSIYEYFYPRGNGTLWDYGLKCGCCGVRFSLLRHPAAFAMAMAHRCHPGDTIDEFYRNEVDA